MLEFSVGLHLPTIAIDVDLKVGNEILVLFGPSGAGKTLTIKMIAGLVRPNRGLIQIDGRTIFDAVSGIHVPPQQRNVGYVPQRSGVFPHLTAMENVALPLRHGPGRMSAQEARERSLALLDRFGLRSRAGARPDRMSGGELQRVALARMLAIEPEALLVDEPFAALDAPVRAALRREFRQFQRDLGIPAIFITHDVEEAAVVGDRLAILVGGQLRQVGRQRDVLDTPADRDVARLVQSGNMFEGTVVLRDHGTVVDTTVGRIRASSCNFEPGQPVTAVIRPEGVRVLREDRDTSRFAEATILQGVILEIADHGALTSVVITVAGGQVTVTLPPTAASNLELSIGNPVRLAIPPERVHLIPS